MKEFHFTDPDTISRILGQLADPVGRFSEGSALVKSFHRDINIDDVLLLELDQIVDNGLLFEFRDRFLHLHLSHMEENIYRVEEAVVTPIERISNRIPNLNIPIHSIHYSLPVDLASHISDMGDSPFVHNIVEHRSTVIAEKLVKRGFSVQDVSIVFFNETLTPFHLSFSEHGNSFFLLDSINQRIYGKMQFYDPTLNMEEQEVSDLYSSYRAQKIRSCYIFPFRDHHGNIPGLIRVTSGQEFLGNPSIEEHLDPYIRHLQGFFKENVEPLLFHLESQFKPEWLDLSENEEIVDLSENGKGCRVTLRKNLIKDDLQIGARLIFKMNLEDKDETYFATLKNIIRDSENDDCFLGLRIQDSGSENGLYGLTVFAQNLANSIENKTTQK